jgi:hypothetical protein
MRELNAQLHSSRKLWLPRKSRNSLPFMNPEPVESSIQLYKKSNPVTGLEWPRGFQEV